MHCFPIVFASIFHRIPCSMFSEYKFLRQLLIRSSRCTEYMYLNQPRFSIYCVEAPYSGRANRWLLNLLTNFFVVLRFSEYSMFPSFYLKWLKTVSSTKILMGCYSHSLSLDATNHGMKKLPNY